MTNEMTTSVPLISSTSNNKNKKNKFRNRPRVKPVKKQNSAKSKLPVVSSKVSNRKDSFKIESNTVDDSSSSVNKDCHKVPSESDTALRLDDSTISETNKDKESNSSLNIKESRYQKEKEEAGKRDHENISKSHQKSKETKSLNHSSERKKDDGIKRSLLKSNILQSKHASRVRSAGSSIGGARPLSTKSSVRNLRTIKKNGKLTSNFSGKRMVLSIGSSFANHSRGITAVNPTIGKRNSGLNKTRTETTLGNKKDLMEDRNKGVASHGLKEAVIDQESKKSENELSSENTQREWNQDLIDSNKDLLPYQHLGQLDPALNIPMPKPGEKTLKDFCSGFKVPLEDRKEKKKTESEIKSNQRNSATVETQDSTISESEAVEESGPVVEVINGQIVIKESSMIINKRRTTEEIEEELKGNVVHEESVGLTATYSSFTNRNKSIRWSVEETYKFYNALRMCGTDFSTMESFFDGTDGSCVRNRKQLKRRYLMECRKNPKLIDMAMNPSKQKKLDISVFGNIKIKKDSEVKSLVQSDSTATVQGNESTKTQEEGHLTPSSSISLINKELPAGNNGVSGEGLINTTNAITVDDVQKIDENMVNTTTNEITINSDREKETLTTSIQKSPEKDKKEDNITENSIPIALLKKKVLIRKKPKFKARGPRKIRK
eukprot:CAMPEP_0184872156 /NCGR_PEP_ID=MMETSP0580-20130426/41124_1 /TAXON_ID=1118495 /ORGANISM="Dactyliosolen fragilissimus" /LENGTH=662 /DNA_ID=CAMNT_0027374905 /DNA_START=96 /DNA_END=2084 /DNA_ORIENTATION=+